MEQPTKDVEAPITHDQLPSVDEVKIDAGIVPSKRWDNARKQAIWIGLAVGVVVLILSIITIVVISKEGGSLPETVDTTNTVNLIDPALEKVVSVLQNVSDYEQLVSPGTPQNRAASWINHDHLGRYHLNNGELEELKQRYILAVLFFGMDGPNWVDDLGFLSTKDVCHWFGTSPPPRRRRLGGMHPMFVGAWCWNGQVRDLKFPEGYLHGEIPTELRYLTGLEVVDFGNNPGIQGEFPTFVQNLSNLAYLGLQYCGLKGELPDWLGFIGSLKTLILSNNQFRGTIPSSIDRMTNLEYLYLDDNSLQGDISTFSTMSSLKHLVIEDNLFTGELDDIMVLSKLETMDISHNQIGSTLPSNMWGQLTNLKVLDIHGNSFTGSLPPVDSRTHAQLAFLAVNDNNLIGEIPSSLAQFTSLEYLDLSSNAFDSTLPDNLEGLSNLRYFFVAHNPSLKEGEIPTLLMTMTNLVDLSLQRTVRIGNIPEWMGTALPSLKLLDLANNALEGPIPDSIGTKMTFLQHLLLNRNDLQGSIPSNLSKLTTLLLDQNGLLNSADGVCNSGGATTPNVFTADCGGSQPLIPSCDCCTLCCESADASCNSDAWNGSIDGIWEYNYRRGSEAYEFSKEP